MQTAEAAFKNVLIPSNHNLLHRLIQIAQ